MTGIAFPLDQESVLREVDAAARLSPAFRLGLEDIDVTDYVNRPRGVRPHNLANVRRLLDKTMADYEQANAASSDAWLGPRLHAALRLSRREAGNRGVWRFLGLWAADYVRWRFGPPAGETDTEKATQTERFIGPDYKHALARLWWMAELFRDGKDYAPAQLALSNQDIVNNLFRMDVAHHRPTAQGALAVLRREDGEGLRTGREANALAKAVNAAASTLVLDALALDERLDADTRRYWESQADDHDVREYFKSLPDGPEDPPVPAKAVKRMQTLLTELLAEAPIRGKKDS
ncbi:DUF6339 family protein [Arthrobacter sp. TMN-37]